MGLIGIEEAWVGPIVENHAHWQISDIKEIKLISKLCIIYYDLYYAWVKLKGRTRQQYYISYLSSIFWKQKCVQKCNLCLIFMQNVSF